MIGAGTPNRDAMHLIRPDIVNDPRIFPDADILKRLEMIRDFEPRGRRRRIKYAVNAVGITWKTGNHRTRLCITGSAVAKEQADLAGEGVLAELPSRGYYCLLNTCIAGS